MYISELELHGFKSFAVKTRVTFDSGVTAIVGPNGCGKSNIVDSIRWVLGEQRPSLLRSSAMNDVVFNGTEKKKALGMAEVSLTLINNKGVLPTEYTDVTITRRLYRTGQSEYLLNGTVCRLKDIMDLFMDTGMGADAYSVIELKMVEEILSDKNNERRRLFEEAAGVTRYKEKRRQTLRRLDETMKDLQRVEDIVIEVRKKTRSLQLQSERAEKAKVFKEKLELLDHQYHVHEYQKIQNELSPLLEKIQQLEKEKITLQQELEKAEIGEQTLRGELQQAEKSQAEAQHEVNRIREQIRILETSVRVAEEKITAEKNVIEQYKRDISQGDQDLKELESLLAASIEALEQLDEELQQSEKTLEESRKGFRDVQQNYSRVREELLEAEIETSRIEAELRELITRQVRLESRIESAGDDAERSRSDLKAIENEQSQMQTRLKKSQDEQSKSERSVTEAREKLESAEEKRSILEQQREEQREEVRKKRSELEKLENELSLLQNLATSRDEFPEAVAHLTDHHASSFTRLDLLSDLLQTDEELAPAVEAALGSAMNALVVSSMTEADKAISLLEESGTGRALFIPLQEVSKGTYPVVKGSIVERIRCKKEVQPVADLLLGEVVLTDSLKEAPKAWKKGVSLIVTKKGERYAGGQFIEGGSQGSSSGIRLSLQEKIQTLEKQIIKAQKEVAGAQKELEIQDSKLEETLLKPLRQALEEKQSLLEEKKRDAQRLQSGISMLEKRTTDLETRLLQLTSNEGSVQSELDGLKPKQKKLEQALHNNREIEIRRKDELAKLEEERSIQQNRFNNAQLRFQDVKNKAENLEQDRKRATSGIETLRHRLESRQHLLKESTDRIESLAQQVKEDQARRAELSGQFEKSQETLRNREERSSIKRGEINSLEKGLREIRSRKETNTEILHLQQLTQEKKEMQAKNLSDHIWDTYGLLMNQLKAEIPEEFVAEDVRAEISALRQHLSRIGEINPLAIEEYAEEKERLEFLEKQIQDLKDAEEQLKETIEEINTTANQRFQETFNEIRTNFKTVFSTLFKESDTCDILIDEDAEDPLEARIEIKANPSGKRPSGISQLSGGEKTLTAIALLFAIYLVKPSPFCVLDEVDAPLDDANIDRFGDMIRSFSKETQFIIITHNKKTMSKAEMMYGVTMPETGVSRLVGVKMGEMES